MPTSAQASQRQLEEYLRQLYAAHAAQSNNINLPDALPDYGGNYGPTPTTTLAPSPTTTQPIQTLPMSRIPTFKQDPLPPPPRPPSNMGMGRIPVFTQSPLPPPPSFTPPSPLAGYNQPHYSSPAAKTLADLRANQTPMNTYRTPPFGGVLSNAIPNMVLSGLQKGGQIGTPNQKIIQLEQSRALAEANAAKPGFGSPGLTSLQLDPNLQDPTTNWQNELMALLSKPDTPGQWISPYSQDYLNQLGSMLVNVGNQGAQGYEAAKGDISAGYDQGIAQRDQRVNAFNTELAANASNIGVNYPASSLAQQAGADNAFLDQVAGQNQATDLAYNTKLGQMTTQLGNTLGLQAREGLLTPKQYVGPQSGLSEGDKLKASFLMDEIGRAQSQKFTADQNKLAAKQASSSSSSLSDTLSKLVTGSQDDSTIKYPDLVQALGGIQDPKEKEAALNFWERSGFDPNAAVNLIKDAYAPQFDNPATPNVNEAGQFAPRSVFDPKTGQNKIVYDPPVWSYPTGISADAGERLRQEFQDQMAQYTAFVQQQDTQTKWKDELLKLFRAFSPGLNMTRTSAGMSNDQKTTIPY